MIKGMEILEKTSITKFVTPLWFKILVAVLFIAGTIIGVAFAIYEEDFELFFVSILCAAAFTAIFYIVARCATPETPTGRYRYEVTFDESVKMTEVYEHYKIIGNRGAIYILEDLEPVDHKCDCHKTFVCPKETECDNTSNTETGEKSNYCSNCGEAFGDTDKFCSKCGSER